MTTSRTSAPSPSLLPHCQEGLQRLPNPQRDRLELAAQQLQGSRCGPCETVRGRTFRLMAQGENIPRAQQTAVPGTPAW